jgi:uncharacterized membrane protein
VSTYELALLGHLAGVLMFFSGIAVAAVAFASARRREQPGEIALLLAGARVGVLLVAPGTLLVLGGGLWLVDLGSWDLGSGWLSAALALFVAACALGVAGGRRPRQAREHAARLARDGAPADAELRRLLHDPWSRAANHLSGLLVVAILVLMVVKP